MTLASIATPNWISYSARTPGGGVFSRTVGLHRSCSSVADPPCRHFPDEEECEGGGRYFCSMWRTTGFLMSLAAVAELASMVGFLVIVAGGRLKRESGWRVLAALLSVVAVVQFAAVGIVVSLAILFFLHGIRSFWVADWGVKHNRRIFSITTKCSSSQDGNWILLGFSAPLADPLRSSAGLGWPSRQLPSLQKTGTSS